MPPEGIAGIVVINIDSAPSNGLLLGKNKQ
jgi:hypothetical protein